MDADDRSHPERLERQVAMLESEELDLVGAWVRVVDRDGRPVPSMQRYEQWINGDLDHAAIAAMRFVELPLVNPTLLGQRAVFELGFRAAPDTAMAFPEDYDWFLRVAAAGFRFGVVPRPLLDWVESPGRLTRCSLAYGAEAFDHCRRMHLRAGPLSGARELDLWGAGQTGKRWLRWFQGEGLRVRVVYEVDPRKIGQSINGCPVRHPNTMPDADGATLIVAVGAEGAREVIAPQLRAHGYTIGRDAWFVA